MHIPIGSRLDSRWLWDPYEECQLTNDRRHVWNLFIEAESEVSKSNLLGLSYTQKWKGYHMLVRS